MGSQFDPRPAWRHLKVGVIGGGIGGMAVAVALRRAGHSVHVYERNDYAGEVGASVSCAANGSRWLHEWNVDVEKGDPVVLKQLINRDWKTGEPLTVYSLEDYREKWGFEYYMFHRQYMHAMLKDSALLEDGEGEPAKLFVNHKVSDCQALFFSEAIAQLTNDTSASLLTSRLVLSLSPTATQLNTTSSSVLTASGRSYENSSVSHPTRSPLTPPASTPT